MSVPSKCTTVRAMGRPANALEAFSGRNKTQTTQWAASTVANDR